MNTIASAVVTVVEHLADAHVAALAVAYGEAHGYSPGSAADARQAVPAGQRPHVDSVNQAWSASPTTDGCSIGLALETALAAKRQAKSSVEVVVTGPDSPEAPVRLTSQVVKQLIDSAERRVTMISYAAYQIPAVIAALDAALARGVSVDLILESAEHLDGGGGAKAYAKYRVFHWPSDQRDPPEARLHAKAVIVDGRDVLLTSANMTNAAYDKNIELGVLCRGGSTANRVQKHFDALIARGVLDARRP